MRQSAFSASIGVGFAQPTGCEARALSGGEIGLVANEDAMYPLRIESEKREILTVFGPGLGAGAALVFGIGDAFDEDFVFKLPRSNHSILIENYCFCELRCDGWCASCHCRCRS